MSEPVAERASPLASQLVLVVGFILLVAAGVVTVLVPELTSDEGEDGAEAAEPEVAGSDVAGSDVAGPDVSGTAPAP